MEVMGIMMLLVMVMVLMESTRNLLLSAHLLHSRHSFIKSTLIYSKNRLYSERLCLGMSRVSCEKSLF